MKNMLRMLIIEKKRIVVEESDKRKGMLKGGCLRKRNEFEVKKKKEIN